MRTIAVISVAIWLAGCSPAPKPVEAPREPVKVGPAPPQFNVIFDTTKGKFTVEVHRDWAPLGADRFHELVENKFFDDTRFFRVVRNFVVQFGLNGNPKLSELWRQLKIVDDPVRQSNKRGTITFATAGPGTRTTQVFINLKDNSMLDRDGFAPFGKVTDGMSVVESLYAGYGDMAPQGPGPDPTRIELQGTEYLTSHFERLDVIKTARIAP